MATDREELSTLNRRSSSTTDFPAQIKRWRRQAAMYRLLAAVAKSGIARSSYIGLAADYDDLALRAEETLTSA
jgi:hypothetical protein